MFGIINGHNRYLPLCFASGMVFEFELVTSVSDADASSNANTHATAPANAFTTDNT